MSKRTKQILNVAAIVLPLVAVLVAGGDAQWAAGFIPATLITSKALGNGAANIATWRYQNTGGAGTFGVARTTIFMTPTAARVVTVEQGATAADTTAQKILDAVALTANVPYPLNGWFTVQNNDYWEGFANNTDINGASYGYTFS